MKTDRTKNTLSVMHYGLRSCRLKTHSDTHYDLIGNTQNTLTSLGPFKRVLGGFIRIPTFYFYFSDYLLVLWANSQAD